MYCSGGSKLYFFYLNFLLSLRYRIKLNGTDFVANYIRQVGMVLWSCVMLIGVFNGVDSMTMCFVFVHLSTSYLPHTDSKR